MRLDRALVPAVLALALAPRAAAQVELPFQIAEPASTFTWSASTDLGPIVGDPSNGFQLAGALNVEVTSDASGIVAGRFAGGDALVPDLHGYVPNPLPFLPPVATVDVLGLRLSPASPTFAVLGDGSFTTTVTFTMTDGTLVVDAGVLGSSSTSLVGNVSDPTPVTGTLLRAGTSFQLFAPVATTFAFTDPGTGISGTVNLNGTVQASHTCVPPQSYCTALPNSTGFAASMGWSGTTSTSANDLVLLASGLPGGNNGLAIYSPAPAQTPLGNGNLCVSSAPLGFVLRLPAETASPGGVLTHALDVGAPPDLAGQITPGSTWYFSCWFRDPAAGGSLFNFADGLAVTFCP